MSIRKSAKLLSLSYSRFHINQLNLALLILLAFLGADKRQNKYLLGLYCVLGTGNAKIKDKRGLYFHGAWS